MFKMISSKHSQLGYKSVRSSSASYHQISMLQVGASMNSRTGHSLRRSSPLFSLKKDMFQSYQEHWCWLGCCSCRPTMMTSWSRTCQFSVISCNNYLWTRGKSVSEYNWNNQTRIQVHHVHFCVIFRGLSQSQELSNCRHSSEVHLGQEMWKPNVLKHQTALYKAISHHTQRESRKENQIADDQEQEEQEEEEEEGRIVGECTGEDRNGAKITGEGGGKDNQIDQGRAVGREAPHLAGLPDHVPMNETAPFCKTLNWERQPDFYSLGGTKSMGKTLPQCHGVDYNEQEGCSVHQDAGDLSGSGWIQYQLISNCAKIPSKERPGKVVIKSECTKGVVQKEFLMAPGAVFYGKVSSTWQCLDLCIHNKKCMAAEIRKVDRGLNCSYHYKNINFDVLLSSSDAVLYVLSKQCIRLRDSDLGQTPKRTPATTPPILDLDKDDMFIEAQATYCENITCYLIMNAKLSWKEAQTECEMKHGKLVSIKSAETQSIIERILSMHKIKDPLWIGASMINEIAFTNQSVSLWRVVQGTGNCESAYSLSRELLSRAVVSQGCYMEAKDEREKEFLYTADVPPRSLTPSSCLEACFRLNFEYDGVQDGSVCTCGNSFGMYGPANDCVEPCQGNYSQYCGGLGAHAVFKGYATSRDFSMWGYNEPKNTSTGHWCGALDMFELDPDKRLASRPCNEDHIFMCQMRSDACKTEPNYQTMSWGVCAYFGKAEFTWHQARTHCLSLNGDLMVVDDEEKRKEIQLAAKAAFPSISKRYIWIGLFSRIYYWDDLLGGSELCYTKFSRGEPVFQKNCLYLNPEKKFEWFSGYCEDDKLDFICEIDTSKGEMALKFPARPVPEEEERSMPRPRPRPAGGRLIAEASTDEEDDDAGSGGGTPLSGLEIALIAAIGVVAVALLVGGTMYGVSKQRSRAAAQQQQGDVEMRQPSDRGPAEPATAEQSRTASRQPSSLSTSQQQADTQSAGSPSLKQSRESQSVRFEGAPGSGVDSTSGGAPISGSASSVGASGGGGGSIKGSIKGGD